MKRFKGVVTFFTSYRGWGFIDSANSEYFVHASSIIGGNHLNVGDQVEFLSRRTHKGPAAIEVKVTSRDTVVEDQIEQDRWIMMKKNPFTPQDPVVDPERFAGRRNHIGNAIDCLYNSKNILITGPRGIGKSSIAYQLMFMASGDNRLADQLDIDMGGEHFNCITADHRCSPGNTLPDISASLIASLYRNLGKTHREKGKTQETNIGPKYFKLGEKTDYEKVSAGDLASMFATDTETSLEDYTSEHSGVVFLIDEIDTLEKNIDLASFLKAVAEGFRLHHHLSISFILSGVTGIITDLVVQHASASRLFESLVVGPMTDKEIEQVLDLALKETGVTITSNAKNHICRLSNNFPQPVHLLGYHSFRLDSDADINDEDVDQAKRYIVENVKSQEFQERFGKLINGGNRSIARAFAISKFETTGLSYLMKHCSNLSREAVITSVEEFVKHDILEELEHHVWIFKDPLFRIYFRLAMGIDEDIATKARGRVPRRGKFRHTRRGVEKKRSRNK